MSDHSDLQSNNAEQGGKMNMKDRQCLLIVLKRSDGTSYYKGQIDGIYGPLSRKALEDFQRDFGGLTVTGEGNEETDMAMRHAVAHGIPERQQMESGSKQETGSFWDHIRYWTREEFKCRCGEYHAPYCDGFPAEPDQTLVELLDDIRAHFGRPARRSSGLRCPQHNRDSKGVSNSKHLTGKAMDFFVEGTAGETVRAYAAADPRCAYAYVIEGSYVHVEVK